MRDGSIPVPYNYAITALWTASHYGIPMTIVVASNAEYLVTFSNPDSSSVTSPENATRQLAEVPYAVPPPIRPGHSWVLGVEAVDVEVFHSVLIPDRKNTRGEWASDSTRRGVRSRVMLCRCGFGFRRRVRG